MKATLNSWPKWRPTFTARPAEKTWAERLKQAPTDKLIAELVARVTTQPDKHPRTLRTERLESGSFIAAEYGANGGAAIGRGDYRLALKELIRFIVERTSPGDRVEVRIRGGAR